MEQDTLLIYSQHYLNITFKHIFQLLQLHPTRMGKNDRSRQYRGGGTITKTYSSGVDEMKEHIFDCGRHKDAARFNETQKELSNYII